MLYIWLIKPALKNFLHVNIVLYANTWVLVTFSLVQLLDSRVLLAHLLCLVAAVPPVLILDVRICLVLEQELNGGRPHVLIQSKMQRRQLRPKIHVVDVGAAGEHIVHVLEVFLQQEDFEDSLASLLVFHVDVVHA